MAVLKDLIVHGPSRFLNGINANAINADEGIFNRLVAVDLKATDATITNLTATNARVTQTLTANHIATNTWEAANIANVGGNFYISPTGEQSGTINVTIARTAAPGADGGTYTLTFGVPNGASGGFGVSSTSAAYWTSGARVMATGDVSYNNSKRYPLGTCEGAISGSVTAANNNITAIAVSGVKSEALDVLFTDMGIGITEANGTLSNCVGYKLKISLYERYSNSNYYPIGILLTSLGKNEQQYIDIYGGSNSAGSSYTGFADPVVRIGDLEGLPNIVTNGGTETKPKDWGIYTTNGFFKGKVVANGGRIANWVIELNDTTPPYGGALYTGTFNSSGGIFITPGYTTTTNVGGSTGSSNKTWTITAGQNFGLTTAGVLYAKEAHIAGEITATSGTIGGASITNGVLQIDNANISSISADKLTSGTINTAILTANNITTGTITIGTQNTDNYVYVSKDSKTLTINSESKGWYLVLGKSFGVTNAGYLSASSGKIGGWLIDTDNLKSSSGTVGLKGSGTTSTDVVFWAGNATTTSAPFRVTRAGTLYATGAEISGNIAATSGFTVTQNSVTLASMTSSGIKLGASGIDSSYNIFLDSTEGIKLRNGTTILNLINTDGMTLYTSDDSSVPIASFGKETILGKTNSTYLGISSNGFVLNNINQTLASFGSDLIQIGSETSSRLEITPSKIKGYSKEGVNTWTFNSGGSNYTQTATVNNTGSQAVLGSITVFNRTLLDYTLPNTATSIQWLSVSLLGTWGFPGYTFEAVSATNCTATYDNTNGKVNIGLSASTSNTANAVLTFKAYPGSGGSSSNVTTITITIARSYNTSSKKVSITANISTTGAAMSQQRPYNLTIISQPIISYQDSLPSPSFVLGNAIGAPAPFSFLAGYGLQSDTQFQTILGKYNEVFNNGVFIIGNGTSTSAKSNLFTIDNTGNVNITNASGRYCINSVALNASHVGAVPATGGTFSGIVYHSDSIVFNNNVGVRLRKSGTTSTGTMALFMDTSDVMQFGTSGTTCNFRAAVTMASGATVTGNLLNSNSGTLGSKTKPFGALYTSAALHKTSAPGANTSTYSACWFKSADDDYFLCRPSSSRKFKKDIEAISDEFLDPHKLYDLRVVQFRYKTSNKDDPNNSKHNPTAIVPGFIAEEVAEIYPAGGIINDVDEIDDWDLRTMVPPMLALIQEQHKEIEQLKKEVQELKNR